MRSNTFRKKRKEEGRPKEKGRLKYGDFIQNDSNFNQANSPNLRDFTGLELNLHEALEIAMPQI